MFVIIRFVKLLSYQVGEPHSDQLAKILRIFVIQNYVAFDGPLHRQAGATGIFPG